MDNRIKIMLTDSDEEARGMLQDAWSGRAVFS